MWEVGVRRTHTHTHIRAHSLVEGEEGGGDEQSLALELGPVVHVQVP